MAGLNCCHQLAKAGIKAEVFEASDRVGGRMYSVPGLFATASDRVVELGGEFINSADEDLLGLIDELHLDLLDTWDETGSELIWHDGERRSNDSMWESIIPIIDAADAELAALASTDISYANPAGAETLDNTSVATWLATHSTSGRATWLVTTIMTTEFGLEATEQSVLNLLFYLGSFGTEYDERYRVDGGAGQVPDGLAQLYADRLVTGRSATAITENTDGSYTVSFADGSTEECTILISALPFSVLRTMTLDVALTDVKRKVIDELGYGTNAKLILPFARRTWHDSDESGDTYSDTGLQAGWDAWAALDGDTGAFTSFLGGTAGAQLAELTDAERATELLSQLELFWPGVQAEWLGELARQVWTNVETARGSYACYTLGQWTTIAGAEAEPVGNFFFCGEHTSWEFQGYMNGAAESGRRAAEEVIGLLSGTQRRARVVHACRRRAWVAKA